MRLRRFGVLALVAVMQLAVAATRPNAIGAAAPVEGCRSIPDGAALVVPSSGGVVRATAAGVQPLVAPLPADALVAARGPDGTVWATSLSAAGRDVVRVPAGGEASTSISGDVDLTSVGLLGDETAAVIIDRSPEGTRPDEPDHAGAVLVEYADGTQVDTGPATGPEFTAASTTIGAGRLVAGWITDNTETFAFFDVDRQSYDDWFVPTDSAPYAEPPQYLWPVAAAPETGDVSLSWLEGPDWDVASGDLVGTWTLVVADAVTGAESVRVDLGMARARLLHADFDGDFWVGTFDTAVAASATDESDLSADRVVIVDARSDDPTPLDAGCPTGVTATLDRFGDTAPPPSTTVAPTTSEPVCSDYTPNDQYPLRLCDQGPAVRAVQQALAASGAQIDIDGDFGPRTDHAVRQFQQNHGLQVDGLVGPDTWAVLITFAAPPGTDVDGNGIVDPSEVGVGPVAGTGPVNPFSFLGQTYMVGADGSVLDENGTPAAGLTWRSARDLFNSSSARPFQAWHVSGQGTEYLWMVGMQVAEPPVSWQVTDLAELGPLAPGLTISYDCTHPADPNVAVVVDATGQPATDSAWRFNTYSEAVEWLNPIGVACPS